MFPDMTLCDILFSKHLHFSLYYSRLHKNGLFFKRTAINNRKQNCCPLEDLGMNQSYADISRPPVARPCEVI